MTTLLTLWSQFAPKIPLIVGALPEGDGSMADVRAISPEARIEHPELNGIENWLKQQKPRRIDLFFADSVETLRGVEELFFKNRIDAVWMPPDVSMATLLNYHLFNFFMVVGENYQQIHPQNFPASGKILALHHRFTTTVQPNRQHMDMPDLFKRCSLSPRGVIHIGAHEGEEMDLYTRMGFHRVLFIEANPAVYAKLTAKMQGRQGVVCLLCAISDSNGMEVLHVTTNDESSSILPLKVHAELYPTIREEHQVLVPSRRLDHLLREIGHNTADYNLLHIDIQGAELKALQGAVQTLPFIDAISTEINYEELYEGCPLAEDLDEFLEPFEFQRMFTATPSHPQWGDAFYLRQPQVTMRNLGQWGRLGNQVFEYAFTKIFAKRHRLHVRTSRWPGNQLFGANDPLVDPNKQWPQYLEQTYALKDSQVANITSRPVNFDLCGVFQYHTAYYAPHKEMFRKLLQPVPALRKVLNQSLDVVRAKAKTLVALHLRRGDYGYGLFFLPPNEWYQKFLAELWPTLDSPMLYIATDEPAKVVGDFAQYHPVTATDLKIPSFGADYYPDFYVLSQADHLAISNSSYSFSACMLNERSTTFLRPDLFKGDLVSFDPWNAEPLLHRELGILDFKLVMDALPKYKQNPGDVQMANAFRNWRAQYADSFAQIKGEQLKIVLSMDLWTGYNLIRRSNLRSLPMVDAERQILVKIQQIMAAGQGRDAIGPYIAATLYAAPSALPAVDLSSLPADIQEVLRS